MLQDIGSIGFSPVLGLAFSPEGALYATHRISDNLSELLFVDVATGNATVVSSLNRGVFGLAANAYPPRGASIVSANQTRTIAGNNLSFVAALSADGRIIAMNSEATNLVAIPFSFIPTNIPPPMNVFVRDLASANSITEMATVNSDGTASVFVDPQTSASLAKALSSELATTITPGFEALVFKASRGIEDIYELTYIRKDGSRFPAVVSVTALRDADSTIIGYLLIGTDNTARKQIEAEQTQLAQRLRDHQFYTRSLFESNIDALMTTDAPGIITDVNKQMEALTGCTRDELIGAPFKNFFTDPDRAEAGIRLALSKRKVKDYELTARDKERLLVAWLCLPRAC
jgi:PAS domain-containing protein